MRRLIQATGAEVIHLGHNRSVDEIVRAAIQEDADAIAISSYQGGHLEFFRYLVDTAARARGRAHPRLRRRRRHDHAATRSPQLEAYGVERIYHPDDGLAARPAGDDRRPRRADAARSRSPPTEPPARRADDDLAVGRMLSALEDGVLAGGALEASQRRVGPGAAPACRSSASPARAARARAPSPTSSSAPVPAAVPRARASRSSPSTRRAAAPAARCSATASA